jgi:DUF4097 and DUF4098 domain-containing protein YvlB
MKRIAIPLLAGMVFCCTQSPAQKLEFKEHLSKEFSATAKPGSTLAIYNVNGFIRVEGYNGDKVILEIDKTISAKTSEILELGKKEFKVETEQAGDSIIAYIADPFDSRPDRNNNNWNHRRKAEYSFDLDFTVKVPYSINLHISTVNGGDVTVRDVTGSLGVFNVNGAIKVTNAKGASEMRTVNGNVDVDYVAVPGSPSSFKTINGDISISCPATLSADCQYKSFRGEFFTDFPDAIALPSTISKNESKENNRTIYKLNAEPAVRIGNGGTNKLRFETLNGNIYIKKQS